jgi:hypothetical protein
MQFYFLECHKLKKKLKIEYYQRLSFVRHAQVNLCGTLKVQREQ